MLRPLRSKNFSLLFFAHTGSRLGDYVFKVAMAVWTIQIDHSGALLAAYFVAVSTGTLVMLAVGSAVSDRVGARRSMLMADAVRTVALGVLAVVALNGSTVDSAIVIACGAAVGIGDGAFQPAYGRAFADLVPRDQLVAANSLKALSGDSMRVIGAGLGGVLVVTIGAQWAIALDAATFAISFACVAALGRWEEVRAATGRAWRTAWSDFTEATGFVRRRTWLWQSLLLQAVHLVTVFGPFAVTIPLYLTRTLHAGPAAFSTVLVLQAALSIAATLLLGSSNAVRRPGVALYTCLLVTDVVLIGVLALGHLGLTVLFFGLIGASLTVMGVLWNVTFQANVPVNLQGRVGSVDFLVSMALEPVALALLPLALAAFSLRSVMIAGAGVATVAAVIALRSRDIRALTTVDEATTAVSA